MKFCWKVKHETARKVCIMYSFWFGKLVYRRYELQSTSIARIFFVQFKWYVIIEPTTQAPRGLTSKESRTVTAKSTLNIMNTALLAVSSIIPYTSTLEVV